MTNTLGSVYYKKNNGAIHEIAVVAMVLSFIDIILTFIQHLIYYYFFFFIDDNMIFYFACPNWSR